MLKSRNFVIGLGVGLIISSLALILSTSSMFNSQNIIEKQESQDQWTIEELKQIASEQGFFLYTEEEVYQLVDNATEEVKNSIGTISNETESNEEPANSEISNADDDSAKNKRNKDGKTLEKAIHFEIKNGMDSYNVTNYLYNIGVLKDKQKFISMLYNQKLTTRILAKKFTYDKELTVEELVDLITY